MPTTMYPLDYFFITPEISVMLTILGILSIVIITIYFYVQVNISYITQNWDSQKCRYGIVIGDYSNLVECSQNALKSVVDTATRPLYEGANMIQVFFTDLANKGNVIANVLIYIKTQIVTMITSILAMIYKLLIPVQIFLLSIFTIFSKVKAVLVSQLYFMVASILTIKSFLEATINSIIIALMALAALIVLMMIIPFGWGVAAAFLVIFVSISVPLAAFVAVMSKVTKLHIFKIPSKPHVCFDKDTRLSLLTGETIPINNVNIGDTLHDGAIITATMVLSIQNAKMFYLHNVLVTGSHLVHYNKTWIPVEDHPDSIHIPFYSSPYVYCVNTNTGILKIGSTTFTDWNEMLVDDFIKYPENFQVELNRGIVPITDCRIGDTLTDSRVITGIVTTISESWSGYAYHLYYN